MMYGTLRREFEELKSQIHLASCVCVVSVLMCLCGTFL